MQIETADHKLTEDEIRERFGPLVRRGVEAFRADPDYLIAMAELAAEQRRFGAGGNAARNVEIVRLHRSRNTVAEIAEVLGMHPRNVQSVLTVRGVSRDRREVGAVETVEADKAGTAKEKRERFDGRVRADHANGLTLAQSAERIGVSAGFVGLIRKRLGLANQYRIPSAELVVRRERVAELLAGGATGRQIQESLGISLGTFESDKKAVRREARA